jgi:hypothetical protein
MHLPAGFLAGFGQGLEEIVPVNVIQEDILTPVSTTHDVVHRTRVFNAQLASLRGMLYLAQNQLPKSNRKRRNIWVDPYFGLRRISCPSQTENEGIYGLTPIFAPVIAPAAAVLQPRFPAVIVSLAHEQPPQAGKLGIEVGDQREAFPIIPRIAAEGAGAHVEAKVEFGRRSRVW